MSSYGCSCLSLQDAVPQHIQQVVYQSGFWTTSGPAIQRMPSPEGRRRDNIWELVQMTVPEAAGLAVSTPHVAAPATEDVPGAGGPRLGSQGLTFVTEYRKSIIFILLVYWVI